MMKKIKDPNIYVYYIINYARPNITSVSCYQIKFGNPEPQGCMLWKS